MSAAGTLDDEWRANSYDDRGLDVDGESRRVSRDTRLRDAVSPWLAPGTRSVRRSDRSRVWGLTVVRNEADVIRANLWYHLSLGLERILVVDNGSTDQTGDILESLA